jgi:anti-anti-sigma factor
MRCFYYKNTLEIRINEYFKFDNYRNFKEILNKDLDNDEINLFILDFSECEYMDSAGIGMLLLLHQETASRNKEIKIVKLNSKLEKIIKITNIDRLISCENSII